MLRTRSLWVDTVKMYACILVVLGHFFQSMVAAEILPSSYLYGWFNSTIYYFHVPLFFICSGYLYQKTTEVRSISQWKTVVVKKGISLGVPYFFFSIVTWLLKSVFSNSVNEKADGLIKTLFVSPLSPYWYLYALFFLFCVTVTIKNNREAVCIVLVATLMKAISCIWTPDIYVVKYLMESEIWFVLGMILCFFKIPERINRVKNKYIVLLGCAFVVASVVVYMYPIWKYGIAFIMGLMGCLITLLMAVKVRNVCARHKIFYLLSTYTFPIFLMHTIFAAGIRSILLKIGIFDPVVHVFLGLTMSFVGPVLAAVIMSKFKWMEFLLYPTKIIRIGGKENGKKT